MKKIRVLFTTPLLKHPAIGGPFLRIENSIKALSEISELIIYSRASVTESEIEFYQQFCLQFYCEPRKRFINHHISRVKRLINITGSILVDWKPFPWTDDYHDFLRVADELQPDIIWLGFGNISYPLLYFLKKNSRYRVVCDTDSVWSRFVLRGLPYAKTDKEKRKILRQGREKEAEEQWGTQLADVTTAVSDIDAEYYRGLTENPDRVRIFSNVIDCANYRTVPARPDGFKNPCIYLAGTFWPGSPMEEAARWMIFEVIPIIRKVLPNIHCYIIGNGSDTVLYDIQDPGITIKGQLPSILPYLCHSDIVVVPLKFESGTRFKILEAGACGIPVVSTTVGAEGIPINHEINILIADHPESFAQAIIRLLSDPEFSHRLGSNLQDLINKKYDIQTLIREGELIIKYLQNTTT